MRRCKYVYQITAIDKLARVETLIQGLKLSWFTEAIVDPGSNTVALHPTIAELVGIREVKKATLPTETAGGRITPNEGTIDAISIFSKDLSEMLISKRHVKCLILPIPNEAILPGVFFENCILTFNYKNSPFELIIEL